MLNPTMLEIMVDDIQMERRHEADLGRLSRMGKTTSRFQERIGHFLIAFRTKDKEQVQDGASSSKA